MAKPNPFKIFGVVTIPQVGELKVVFSWVPVKSSGRTSIAYVLDAVEWTWI